MGLLDAFQNAAALAEHNRLAAELSTKKAKGLSDTEAAALLIIQEWWLPPSYDSGGRAALLSKNLGGLVIGFLVFTKRVDLATALQQELPKDPCYDSYGFFFSTAGPLTAFAREHVNRSRKNRRTNRTHLAEAGFAAFYATLVAPLALDAWRILAELKPLGFCPDIDTRDHLNAAVNNVLAFLHSTPNADPAFRLMLIEGLNQLRGGSSPAA